MKRLSRRVALLALALTAVFALNGCGKKSDKYNILIHSHNDYDQERPFFGAYEAGADCIEADVWLIDGNLLVSHNRKDVDSRKTIQSMYLTPLKEKMDANGGKAYADGKRLQIMVDLKNDQVLSLGRLVEIIENEGYKDCFDFNANPSAARLVITNSNPIIAVGFAGFPEYVLYDGVPDMDIPDEYYKKIVEVSDCARNVTSWRGEGEMSESDRETILKAVEKYHGFGSTYRLWDFPDGPAAWEMSLQLGLDYINTDHPAEAAAWLANRKAGDQPAPVNYKLYFNWPERNLPDFSTLGEPDRQGTSLNFDLRDFPDTANHFAVLFESVLKVGKAEDYTFWITSDDGTRFFIDGKLVIENDGAHGPILKKETVRLGKGEHDLRLEYFDCDKGQMLELTYFTPTIPKRQFNAAASVEEDLLTSKDGFVKPQVNKAYARFRAWKGEDETIVFPILTDVHTSGRFTWKHFGYAATAGTVFGADFMVNLGDIGLNVFPANLDAEYAASIVSHTLEGMKKYDGIWLYAPGNHDWDAGEERLFTEEELSETFQKPWQEKAGEGLHLTPGKTYGYYDLPRTDCRVIFLNSTGTGTRDGFYYIFDDAQLEWLRALLEETSPETPVIVLSHYMPHPIGRWATSPSAAYTLESNDRIMSLLSEYAAKRTLVGMFTGDSHVNGYVRENGVNYYISQGYGSVGSESMVPGTRRADLDYRQSLCIDVVAVKPDKREVRTFRIGAGGEEFDESFKY